MMTNRLQSWIFVTLLTLATAAAPAAACAQPGPPQETIHGQIASFDGAGNLQLNDDRGFVDTIQVGPETIVNPGNRQLQPGKTVTIIGVARGSFFAASRIDVAGEPAPVVLAPPPPPSVSHAAGVLNGIIAESLDSKSAFVGEGITLHDVASTDGLISGATLRGTVTAVTPPGQGRNAQIRLHFDSMRLHDGTTRPIDGEVVSIDVKTKSNTAKEIGGAILGMLAGNAIGKTLFGVGGGGLLGAVGGYFVAKDNRANVVIPADTTVTVQLVNARRQTE